MGGDCHGAVGPLAPRREAVAVAAETLLLLSESAVG